MACRTPIQSVFCRGHVAVSLPGPADTEFCHASGRFGRLSLNRDTHVEHTNSRFASGWTLDVPAFSTVALCAETGSHHCARARAPSPHTQQSCLSTLRTRIVEAQVSPDKPMMSQSVLSRYSKYFSKQEGLRELRRTLTMGFMGKEACLQAAEREAVELARRKRLRRMLRHRQRQKGSNSGGAIGLRLNSCGRH